MQVRVRRIEHSLSLSEVLWRMREGMHDRGLRFVTASAATRIDQGTVLVPTFIAVPLGPDVEVGADAMVSALATLDGTKPRELADQLRVRLVMDVEPTVEDEERQREGAEREAFLQLAFPGRRKSVQSERELDYGISSEDGECATSEDEIRVPEEDVQVVSCDIDEGQDDSDGDTVGAVALRFLDAKSAAKQRLEQEVRKNLKRIDT